MKGDVIRVKNMRFYAYHGDLPEEAKLGQEFQVDVDVWTDFAKAAMTDNVKNTIHYGTIYRLTEELVTGKRFNLVEKLAEEIAVTVKDRLDVDGVLVRVRKPNTPIEGHFDCIEVEIKREFCK